MGWDIRTCLRAERGTLGSHGWISPIHRDCIAFSQFTDSLRQRQTIISQFYQFDKLVVEGQETVSAGGGRDAIHPQSFGLITCTGKAKRGPRRHRAPKGHWVRFSSFPLNDIPPVDSVVLTMPAVGINRAAPTHQLSPVSFRSPPLSFGF